MFLYARILILLLFLAGVSYASGIYNPGSGSGGNGGGLGANCTLITDASSNLWAACVDTTGHLVTFSLGAAPTTMAPIVLVDGNGIKWNLTVRTTGNLETELH